MTYDDDIYDLDEFQATPLNPHPLYISYATPAYYPELRQLIKTLDDLNLPYCVDTIPSFGTWQRNTQYKVEFIRNKLTQFKRPVVWVDADARIRQNPIIFRLLTDTVDVAVHYRDDTLGRRLSQSPDGEVLSGTIYFNYSSMAFEVLDKWEENNKANPNIWEQKNLQRALEQVNADIFKLPPSYCQIIASGKARMGDPNDAVIAHTQASRRLKNKVHSTP